MEFFAAGAEYRERCFMSANRVGKTFGAGGYEPPAVSPASTRTGGPAGAFEGPVRWWAAGKTNETTRDILQATLLGGIAQREGRKRSGRWRADQPSSPRPRKSTGPISAACSG